MIHQILGIYGWTIAASVVLAAGLSLLGCQLAARDRAMQTLCMGQGAMLGVLLGLGIIQTWLHESGFSNVLPLAFAFISAAVTFILSEFLVARKLASSNTHFTSLFAVLLSGGYLVSALFPALENHMAQKYFGDLATINANESYIGVVLGLCLLAIMIRWYRSFTKQSFEKAITGQDSTRRGLFAFSLFDLLCLAVLSYCIQTVGYLFTIACLFIPTAFASRSLPAGLKRHLLFCALVAALATGIGFCLSLQSETLPTVPVIIVTMLCMSLSLSFLLKKRGGRSLVFSA